MAHSLNAVSPSTVAPGSSRVDTQGQKQMLSWAWWGLHVIPVLERIKWFWANLGYTASTRPVR